MTLWKEPADVPTTEALDPGPAFPASGLTDGVALEVGDRVHRAAAHSSSGRVSPRWLSRAMSKRSQSR